MDLPLLSPLMQKISMLLIGAWISTAVILLLFRTTLRGRRIKFAAWSLFIILCAVSAYTMFYTVSNWTGRDEVIEKYDKMRSAGFPLSYVNLNPKPPPEFQGNISAYEEENGDRFYMASIEIARGSKAMDLMRKTGEKHKDQYNIEEWSAEDQTTAKEILADEDTKLIFNLFKLGAEKPYAFHSMEKGEAERSYLYLCQRIILFRLIWMRSSYDGQRNDLNGAYHLIEDGFKFIRQYQNEPTMISWIFNVSNASISCKALCSLIKLKGVSDSQAKRFFELIDSLDFLSSINPALQGDFALCARPCFENFFREGNSSDNLKSLFGTIEDHNSFLNDIWPFYYQGYAFYLDYTLSQKLNIKKSDLWRMSLSWVCGNTTRTKELRRAAFYMRMPEEIVRIRMAELTRKAARVYSELDAARISLALHIYKNNNGAFPDSLEKLAPAILPEIPADPMTGKPFGYQRKGDYFELDCMHFKEKPVR